VPARKQKMSEKEKRTADTDEMVVSTDALPYPQSMTLPMTRKGSIGCEHKSCRISRRRDLLRYCMSASGHRLTLPPSRIRSSRFCCKENMWAWYCSEGESHMAVNRNTDPTDLSYLRPQRSSKRKYSDPLCRRPPASTSTTEDPQAPVSPFDFVRFSPGNMRRGSLMQTNPYWPRTDPRPRECYKYPRHRC
jgi:hypothetical protein